jgi:hypothetical protein
LKRIDWQAYLDGSMFDQDRQDADRLLAESERARSELNGLMALRDTVRDAALSAPVPEDQLAAMLTKAVAKPRFSIRRVIYAVAPVAAAAAIAWYLLIFDPMRLDRSPTRQIYEPNNPRDAAAWVRQRRPFKVPVIDLGRDVELMVTRVGDNWACYDFLVDGQVYYLYMSPDPSPLRKAQRTAVVDGTTFYYGRGVGWEKNGLGFYIKRGDEQVRERMASRIAKHLESPSAWMLSAVGKPDVFDLQSVPQRLLGRNHRPIGAAFQTPRPF